MALPSTFRQLVLEIASRRLMGFARQCALGLPEKRAGSFLATTFVLDAIFGSHPSCLDYFHGKKHDRMHVQSSS